MDLPSPLRWVFRGSPPVLWVGAGASCQADPPLPTLWRLASDLQRELWPESPAIGDPYAFIDSYVTTFKARGGLANFLEAKLRPGGRSARPGSLHAALARLIGAGKVSAIIDTNYDLILRQALEQAGAAYLPSTLSGNLELPSDAVPRYWALHGDHGDWLRTVLDGDSYATYHQRHPLAIVQLELYLRQRPILFVGCSMQDPRIVDWLAALDPDARNNLHGLVAVLDSRAKAELEAKAATDPKYAILIERLLIAELPDFAALPRWFEALADELAPRPRVAATHTTTSLVGREPERTRLREAMLAPRCRVAVLGPAGVGKTTLVRAVVEEAATEPTFVTLAGLDSADAIAGAVASALGVSGRDLGAAVAARLVAKPTLLILDELENAWHRDAAAVESLLCAWSTPLIATLRGAQWPTDVFDDAIELDELSPTHARELFVRHAPKHAAAGPELDELLVELGGIPLAIELLARRAQAMSLPVLRKTWASRRDRLLPGWVSAVGVVYESPRMTAEVRELLGMLAEVPGGVALDDYDAVLGESWPDALDAAIGLGMAEDREGRLHMHGLVREFVAREHSASEAGRERACVHYLSLARELGPKPGWPGGHAAAQRLASELANVEAAILRGLARTDPREVIAAALALRYFGMFAGGAVGRVLEAALARSEAIGDPALAARCLQSLADIARERGQLDRALPLLERALASHESLGSAVGRASCIWRLGDIALTRGQLDDAAAQFERALAIYEPIADVLGRANCIRSLGDVALARGALELAGERYRQAQPLYQQIGAGRGHANCLAKLGEIAVARGELASARELYRQARPIYEAAGDVLGMAECLVKLAEVSDEPERTTLREQARATWMSVDRPDLVALRLG